MLPPVALLVSGNGIGISLRIPAAAQAAACIVPRGAVAPGLHRAPRA